MGAQALASVASSPRKRSGGGDGRRRSRESRLALPRFGIDVGGAMVENPNPVGPAKVAVEINRRVDLLEQEFSYHRISKAAFTVGREIQAVLEAGTSSGLSSWSDGGRGDGATLKDGMMIRGVINAQRVKSEMDRLRGEVGMIGARFLREMLSGVKPAEYARERGQTSDYQANLVGDRFRWLLEQIAEKRAAVGVKPKPKDAHPPMVG